MSVRRFFGGVWSLLVALVRSLLALFFARRRAADPFPLRPVVLSTRAIALPRIHSATTLPRTHSATTLPNAQPARTSPKLDPEQGTPDTTTAQSLPRTPPDLAPATSVTDCPYSEPPDAISNALIARSKASIKPYDTSDASLVPIPPTSTAREPNRQLYPQFHHPEPFAYAWRRHSAHLPGRPAHARSRSHADLYAARTWYDLDAYVPSPVSVLSPPLETSTDSADALPLGRVREQLARLRKSPLGYGAPGDTRPLRCKMSHARRMSEGCLLTLAQSTPTRVGVSRRRISVAPDRDWLDMLSLRPSPDK